jgi:hypothetical protein
MISFLQRVLGFATAATLSALSGAVNAVQVGPEPINTPSLTFPGDTVSSPKRGPGCQGIVHSLLTPPVFVAEAQPPVVDQAQPPSSQPPDDSAAAAIIQKRGQRVIDGLEAWDQKRRSLPPVPGG